MVECSFTNEVVVSSNHIAVTSNLVKTNVVNTKISEAEYKTPDHDTYITTSEFNKSTEESFAARLEQANLVTKTDFDNKLTKHLEVQKKHYFKIIPAQEKIIIICY